MRPPHAWYNRSVPRNTRHSCCLPPAFERGTIVKPHAGRLLFALAFPNTYKVGMSSLGFQVVYALLNGMEQVACERVFLPDQDDQPRIRQIRTVESGTPVADADVVGFSVYFELDYANVLAMLELAGIPLRSADRDEGHPLVVAGGPAMMINPEPLAGFVDAVAVGDGEELVPELASRILEMGAEARGVVPRRQLLQALADVEGVYVPSLYKPVYGGLGVAEIRPVQGAPYPVRRRVTRDLGRYDVTSAIVTPNTEFGETLLTEVARGCARGCRFCFAGYGYRPVRYRRAEDVHPLVLARALGVEQALRGARRVGLVGSSLSDNPSCVQIAAAFADLGVEVSLSSVRAETMDRQLAEAIARSGQHHVTLAPEAATPRLRRVIRKPITDEQLHRAVDSAASAGIRDFKLYFLLGLPTETDEDAAAIADLALALMREHGIRSVTVSLSPLVPKPSTPFQWHPMERAPVIEARRRLVERRLAGARGVKVQAGSVRLAEVQALLSRGDRRLAEVLEAVRRHAGDWRAAIREVGLDVDAHLRRERARDELFPWDVLDLGLDRETLWREYQLALRGLLRDPRGRSGSEPLVQARERFG